MTERSEKNKIARGVVAVRFHLFPTHFKRQILNCVSDGSRTASEDNNRCPSFAALPYERGFLLNKLSHRAGTIRLTRMGFRHQSLTLIRVGTHQAWEVHGVSTTPLQ
jgi:hypothetical protein